MQAYIGVIPGSKVIGEYYIYALNILYGHSTNSNLLPRGDCVTFVQKKNTKRSPALTLYIPNYNVVETFNKILTVFRPLFLILSAFSCFSSTLPFENVESLSSRRV